MVEDGPELGALLAELDLAAGDPAHVEQIVDQAAHVTDLALEHLGRRLHRLAVAGAEPQHLHGVAHRSERISQLVRQHRQELVLAAIGVGQVGRETSRGRLRPACGR